MGIRRTISFISKSLIISSDVVIIILDVIKISLLDGLSMNHLNYFLNNLVFLAFVILRSIISIYVLFAIGIRGLYYKQLKRIKTYLFLVSFLISMLWLFSISNFLLDKFFIEDELDEEKIEKIESFKILLMILFLFYTILIVLDILLTIRSRNDILNELDESPLSYIDDTLTEELYKNIIKLAKAPENKKLIERQRTLTKGKKKRSRIGTWSYLKNPEFTDNAINNCTDNRVAIENSLNDDNDVSSKSKKDRISHKLIKRLSEPLLGSENSVHSNFDD